MIKQLKEAKDIVKYTLELGVTKKDKKWQVDQISDETEDKILGIYNY